jgi:hypothetical protein
MATNLRILAAAAACAVATSSLSAASAHPAAGEPLDSDEIELMGNAGHVPDSTKPKLTAYFEHESYRAGDLARLVVTDVARRLTVRIYRAGTEAEPTLPSDVMLGTPVSPAVALGGVEGRRVTQLRIGNWPSGVYFARLTAQGSRIGYAPFVLAPRTLGEHSIAVVMPTQTWQAYNFRDDNGDGHPDTWYAGWKTHTARLVRAFLNRGVPPHWKHYDAPFVRWLVHTGRNVDFLSDAELRNVRSGDELARAYNLIVFSGHHEYVTGHEYDVVQRYRDLGGNLAFLAANDFFWKITIANHVMTRVAEWRDLGRPEAALIGVQYRANDRGGHRGAWIVQAGAEQRESWLFRGMNVHTGSAISSGGVEIDATASASPKTIRVLADIPDLYGPGFTAQMTYYETPSGAKVFAAGAFSLAGNIGERDVNRLMTNLWRRLSAA